MRLTFQAIPSRSGLRLDGLGINPARIAMGAPLPSKQPDLEIDTPPMRRWREKWGDDLEAALHGQIADVLPGEGLLLHRHVAWSMERAERLLVVPKKQAEMRKAQKEMQRLERYGNALKSDMVRHQSMLLLREPAMRLQAELWRLKGATHSVELLDGTRIDLPLGQRVEETVQAWFKSVKKAERGLRSVAVLEKERMRCVLEIGGSDGGHGIANALGTGCPQCPSGSPASGLDGFDGVEAKPSSAGQASLSPGAELGQCDHDSGHSTVGAAANGCRSRPLGATVRRASAGQGGKKVRYDKNDRRVDGKGRAYRSLMLDQFEVLIGKGDAENDSLTFRVADSQDFWLHVANFPGSHVIIRNPDRLSEPPRGVLERAAELAAFFSKARDGGKVEVHWCRVADVNKPRGFAPGKVILKSHKSVKVYPNSFPQPR
jgi:hypothetical protein